MHMHRHMHTYINKRLAKPPAPLLYHTRRLPGDRPYNWRSVSKAVVSAVVLAMQDDKLLSIDDTIAQVCLSTAAFPTPQPARGTKSGIGMCMLECPILHFRAIAHMDILTTLSRPRPSNSLLQAALCFIM